jgi:hypothetical protein
LHSNPINLCEDLKSSDTNNNNEILDVKKDFEENNKILNLNKIINKIRKTNEPLIQINNKNIIKSWLL